MPIPAPAPPAEDPDYVWDVFYHRARLNEYDKIGNVGTLWVFSLTLSDHIAHCLCFIRTGLPASFADPFSSDSESEPEDEADEDSNGKPKTSSLVILVTDPPQRRNTIRTIIRTRKALIHLRAVVSIRQCFINCGVSSFWHADVFHESSDYDEMLRDGDSDTAWR